MTRGEPQTIGSCPECAALVLDLDKHADWHERTDRAGGRDDSRTIGNMR